MRVDVKRIAIAAAVAALPWAVPARAQEAGGPPRGRHGFGPGGRFAQELGLTDDQRAQLEALRQKQHETLPPLMESARQAREAFRKALEAENADAATVGQAALAMRDAEKKLRAAHEAAFEEMKAILTPEQRDALAQMKERHPRGPRGPRF